MAEALVWLVAFHLLFFRKFYFQNPYCYATSEALEQGFSSSVLLGRAVRLRQFPPRDVYYYPVYDGLPFLSTYYPPHILQAWIGSWLPLNQAWILYVFTMVLHFLGASVACYCLLSRCSMSPLVAGCGAITISHVGYSMKQNSSIVYTLTWVPILLLGAMDNSVGVFGISMGMMLLAGYWPVALYAIGLGCLCWLWPWGW